MANINVLAHRDELYALNEGAPPIRLDPRTLHAGEETDFEGVLMPGMHAHYRVVPGSSETIAFGLSYGRESVLHLYRFPADGDPRHVSEVGLGRPLTMLHDVCLAGRLALFLVHPVRVRVARMMLGLAAPLDSFAYDPAASTRLLALDIDSGAVVLDQQIAPFYHFHFANGFVDGERIVADLARYDDYDGIFDGLSMSTVRHGRGPDAASGRLVRMTLVADQPPRFDPLVEGGFEFVTTDPRVQGKAHRYVFAAADPFGDAGLAELVRVDVERGVREAYPLRPAEVPGEATLVPGDAPEEGAGHLLAQVYDAEAHESLIAIFDAAAPGRAPLARARFDHHIPPPLHGCFVPHR